MCPFRIILGQSFPWFQKSCGFNRPLFHCDFGMIRCISSDPSDPRISYTIHGDWYGNGIFTDPWMVDVYGKQVGKYINIPDIPYMDPDAICI